MTSGSVVTGTPKSLVCDTAASSPRPPTVSSLHTGSVANGLIAIANELFDLKASSDVEVILFVVLYGIGTDYILFFLFRYRERLREGEEKRPAVAHALERAGEAIASAGGAVIVSFMALIRLLTSGGPQDQTVDWSAFRLEGVSAGAVALGEETREPRKTIPRALSWTIVLTSAFSR